MVLSKEKLSRTLRWIVSIGLLILLFRSIDLETVRPILARTQFVPLLIAFVMLLMDRFYFALRWKMILRPYNANVRVSTLTQITFISSFLANFLPSALSSDVVRGYFLYKERTDTAAVVTSVLLDRFIGFFALLLLSTGAVVIAYVRGLLPGYWLLWVFGTVAATTVVMAIVASNQLAAATAKLQSSARGFVRKIGAFVAAIHEYPWTTRSFAGVTGFAAAVYVLGTIASYLIFYSIGGDLPLSYFFIFTFIVQLAMSIPISIGSLGVHEGAWVILLGSVGVSAGEALVFALLLRTVGLAVSLPGGVLYALYSPRTEPGEGQSSAEQGLIKQPVEGASS